MEETSKKSWYKLDNAAKIFPAVSRKSDTKVIRFSSELTEAVDGAVLQTALDYTLDEFPGFQYLLKRGMFWYYMEQSGIRPLVHEEDTPPCGTRYLPGKTLLFEVTWHSKRINLEVYHALTDGTGALQFLRTLTLHYLKLTHPDAVNTSISIDYDASDAQKMSDSFNKYYDLRKNNPKIKNPIAYQLKGVREVEWRLKIIEGVVSTRALLQKSHEYDATMTVFLTALLMRSIYGEMSVRERRKPVVISVPVNLRNYFDSKSSRNFFSAIGIEYDFYHNSDSMEDIVRGVKECFSKKLNEEYLQNRLNQLLSLEKNLITRLVPLAIKNVVMNLAYIQSARESTASLTNLGKITMPEETKPYIRMFGILYSTNKLQVAVCSLEDYVRISFTAPFVSTDVQRAFFRQLSQMGLTVDIIANDLKKNTES